MVAVVKVGGTKYGGAAVVAVVKVGKNGKYGGTKYGGKNGAADPQH